MTMAKINRLALPVDDVLPQIEASLSTTANLVLIAPPGSGKTTRVAPYLLRNGKPVWAAEPAAGTQSPDGAGRILMLQPRRVAVRAACKRISEETGWQIGREIGYQIRFENTVSRETRFVIVTEAILTRMMVDNPYLDGIAGVILDEFHERNLHSDLGLARLREIQTTIRPELRILVMSATLDPGPVSRFLGGAPLVRSEGRPYPVAVQFHNQTLPAAVGPQLMEGVFSGLKALLTSPDDDGGDILVFLPGAGEIRRALDLARDKISADRFECLPLHGSLTSEEQDRALAKSAKRKIIFATNIAETSLTIDGVSAVIDSGLSRVLRLDSQLGTERLDISRISKASADQRAGRAGRQRPGRCYRLWTRADHVALADFDVPELFRCDLTETVLQLSDWGYSDPARFPWFEAPPGVSLNLARDFLRLVGACAQDGSITDLGQSLLTWPVHPRLSRFLLEATKLAPDQLNCACLMAALLQERDFVRNARDLAAVGESDVLARLELLFESGTAHFSSKEHRESRRGSIQRDRYLERVVSQSARQIEDIARKFSSRNLRKPIDPTLAHSRSDSHLNSQAAPKSSPLLSLTQDDQLSALLIYGYPDRVTKRRGTETKGLMVGGRGVQISTDSAVHTCELFLSLTAHDSRREGRLETWVDWASRIEPGWLKLIFPHLLKEKTESKWSETEGRVVTTRALTFLDLPIEEPRILPTDAAHAAEALKSVATAKWNEIVERNEELQHLISRMEFAAEFCPDPQLPALEPEIQQMVIERAVQGQTKLETVISKPFHEYLREILPYKSLQLLEEIAPGRLEVPTGNKIKIIYQKGKSPSVAVRLQEIFGLLEAPKIARGRVSLTFELLGPNFRPVQVTADLESFWKRGYPEVRKELRSRYPKHSWPEDPYTAKPEAKGRRRT